MKDIGIKYFSVSLLISLLFFSVALADEAGEMFDRAYNLLNEAEYVRSYNLFSQLRRDFPDHKNADKHLFFKGKSAYYTEDYSGCIADLEELVRLYPGSSYVPYGYFFLGNAYYRRADADRAVKAYSLAYSLAADNWLEDISLISLESGAMEASLSALDDLKSLSVPESRRCVLLTAVSRALMKRGSFQQISSLLSSCQTAEAGELIRRADQNLSQKAHIGIALPLSGDFKKYGEQLLDGIMLRIDEFKTSVNRDLTPKIYDTKGDNLEAARVINLLSEEGVIASIGPLTSDAGAIASAALSCSDMPLIIPAASQGGLTELSQNTFQLQPNLDWQGVMMADYAVNRLLADTAAIITPTSRENLRMARAFKQRFEELGGTIIGVEYFRARETDFGPYIRDLKSLVIEDLLDSIIFINEDGDTIEAEEAPVHIDCMYIPAAAEQLHQLLPQIHFYNLNTIYLGGDGWGSETVYKLGLPITKECYFSSALINDNLSEKATAFATQFDLRYGRQPGRLEALGYDAMDLICNTFSSGKYSRGEVSRYLKSVSKHEGIAGMVSFGKHRENIELPIYTIDNGQPVRVVVE